MCHNTEHAEHEDGADDVERDQKVGEGNKTGDAVFADRERHGSERPDRRHVHDDAHHAKENVSATFDKLDHRPAVLAESVQAKGEQQGNEQRLQNVAVRERAEECVRHDVHDVIDEIQGFCLRCI